MKPEQRATRDENHDLEMPRQGVSFLNDMLGWGRHCTRHTRHQTLNDINRLTHPLAKTWEQR